MNEADRAFMFVNMFTDGNYDNIMKPLTASIAKVFQLIYRLCKLIIYNLFKVIVFKYLNNILIHLMSYGKCISFFIYYNLNRHIRE